jgi:hypothetical protein
MNDRLWRVRSIFRCHTPVIVPTFTAERRARYSGRQDSP